MGVPLLATTTAPGIILVVGAADFALPPHQDDTTSVFQDDDDHVEGPSVCVVVVSPSVPNTNGRVRAMFLAMTTATTAAVHRKYTPMAEPCR